MKIKLIAILLIAISLQSVAQIPDGYYNNAEGLTGEALRSALHEIIDGHTEYEYTSSTTDVWDILKETDKDPNNPDNVILIYSGWSVNAAQEYNNGDGWTREHVWAKSHGDFSTYPGAGTDAHHLRPADTSVNSAKSNKDFDNGGTRYQDGDGITDCYTSNYTWEPRDEVKGDVARMMFYMAVRYEGGYGEPDLELVDYINSSPNYEPLHGKLSTLITWHTYDPVDDFERNRNEVVYGYQGNRNPFIDHPEYVHSIWGTSGLKTNLEQSVLLYPIELDDVIAITNLPEAFFNNSTAKVFSLDGKLVAAKELNQADNYMDVSQVGNGLFVVRIESKIHQIFLSKKIVR